MLSRYDRVPSVEPLLIAISSKSAKVCARILSIALERSAPPLRTERTTLTSGVDIALKASAPDPPRRAARLPEILKMHLVAQGVHRLPKAGMPIGRELRVTRQRLQRLRFPGRAIALDPVDHLRVEDKEATIDKGVIPRRLLDERLHHRAVELERAVASRRPDCSDRSKPAVAVMEGDGGGDVDV